MEHDLDRVAPAGEGLVDAVVDELDDEVVQTTQIRGSDVHPGASANGLETLEDLDLIGRVRVLAGPADAYGTRIPIAVCRAVLGSSRLFAASSGRWRLSVMGVAPVVT